MGRLLELVTDLSRHPAYCIRERCIEIEPRCACLLAQLIQLCLYRRRYPHRNRLCPFVLTLENSHHPALLGFIFDVHRLRTMYCLLTAGMEPETPGPGSPSRRIDIPARSRSSAVDSSRY